MTDQELWQTMVNEMEATLTKMREDLINHQIKLECIQVTTKVFEKFGQRHPSTYGLGSSSETHRHEIARLVGQIEIRQRMLELLKSQISDTPKMLFVFDDGKGVS